MTRLARHGVTLLLTVVVLLAAAAGASAAAPTAITGPVTAVGATTATASGTVNPGGSRPRGTSSTERARATARRRPRPGAGSGTANAAVSVALTGLAQGTTYHYRVVATSTSGTSRGSDGLFKTLAAPGAVTGSASSISVSAATLNGTVDPNASETTWWFEYGTSTAYGSKTAVKSAGSGTGPTNVSAGISGLQKGRTYHFRLVATSDGGTTNGADASFVTSSAPAVVTGQASAIAPTTARLNGAVTPNGLATTLAFRLRHVDVLRLEDLESQRRLRDERPERVHRYLRLEGVDDVSLPARGLELGRHDDRQRQDLLDLARARSRHGRRVERGREQCDDRRHRRPARTVDDLVVPVRHDGELRRPDRRPRARARRPGAQNVSAGLTGLKNGTTYHYRLVAKSDAGTTYGSDLTFATAG